jgi:hypothetical protein
VFVLLAVPVGVVVGFLIGGRLERLSQIRFEWGWLAVAGLAVQILLFSTPLADGFSPGVGEALGAISNLAAIVANVGVMPTTAEAMATAGIERDDAFSNSAVLDDPALGPLTDIFAIPAGLPFANVFSIGDVLIALGIVLTIAIGMRRGDPETAAN